MARKAGVDLEAVIDTAAAIADQQGLAAATLAAVAQRLGIQPPSLYAHVAGLAGLRRHLTLRAGRDLAHTLETAAAGHHGAAALHTVAAAYRSWAHTHPGLYAALLPAPRPGVDPELDAAMHLPVAAVARPLAELGATPSDVVPLVRTLRATLHGFVTLEQAGGFALPDGIDASFHTAADIVITGITDRTSTPPPRRQATHTRLTPIPRSCSVDPSPAAEPPRRDDECRGTPKRTGERHASTCWARWR